MSRTLIVLSLTASQAFAASSSSESPTISVDTRSQAESNIISVDTRPHYLIWADQSNLNGANAFPDAIPYSDGITNLLKYAFNMDGSLSGAHGLNPSWTNGLPIVEFVPTGNESVLQIRAIRRKNDPNLVYTAEFSSSTALWSGITEPDEIIPINEAWELATFHDPETAPNLTRRFGRIRVNYNEP